MELVSVSAAVQSIERKSGPLQFLVNNAGYSFVGALEKTSVEEARQQFETNLFGVLRVTNAILPGMRRLEPNAPLRSRRHVRQEFSQTTSTGLIL